MSNPARPRLSSVTDWNSNQTTYGYDDANRMTTVTMPNGVVGTSSYDNANRLTGISYVKSSITLTSVSYTVDAVGNRTDRTDLAGTQTYSYDDDYRLTSVTYPGAATTDYTYDDFGNRTSMTDASGTTNYSYDDAGRLTTVTPPSPASAISYTSDDNGNVTARGSDSFTWDFENRLTAATVNSTSYTYTYRGDGLRNTATTGGNTTSFTWDVSAGLPVVLDDGSQYVYGNGLFSQVAAANTYYYLTDGLGSVMATTDASGTVVNSYTYDVYGKTTASSGAQANDRQFAGQQTDPTGLQYLRARYYDPGTGSFLSRDPLSAGPGWSGSPFGYARATPANTADPTGLCSWYDVACHVEGIGQTVSGAIGGVSDFVKGAIWPSIRAAVNAQLTAAALILASARGGECHAIGDGIFGCGGLADLLDSLGIGGAAFTLGNVILTREKSIEDLKPEQIDHEIRHADQWAWAGLTTPWDFRQGQTAFLLTYLLFTGISTKSGHNQCWNPFEIWAGLTDGHYVC